MPFISGASVVGQDLTRVDSSAAVPLGTQVVADNGATYRYIKAAAAIAANDILHTAAAGLDNLTPISAVAQKPVGVAPVAIASGSYGWVVVRGPATAKVAASTAANSAIGTSATAGTGTTITASATVTQAEAIAAIAAAAGVGILTTGAEAAGKAPVLLS